MEIRFRKGYSQNRKNLYYVDVTHDGDTVYVGFVFKSVTGKWENSKGEEQYRTRREATDALVAFVHVELAAVRHFANATSTDPERSFYQGEIYRASKQALLDTIALTYPDVSADDVYELWVDCGESIAYCVEYLRTERRAVQAEMDAQHAEALEDDAARNGGTRSPLTGQQYAAPISGYRVPLRGESTRPESANGGVIDVVDNNHLIIVSFGTALPLLADDSDKPHRFTTRDGLPAAMVAVDTRGYLIGADTASLLADMIVAAYTQVADTKSIPHTVSILA